MRFTASKPLSFFSKLFRPNTSKKSKFGKATSEGRKNDKKTIRTFLSRAPSSDSNGGGAESGGGTFLEFMRLRKKILIFRDIFDIPPINGSVSIHELVMETIDDLNRMYPDLIPGNPILKMKERNTHQGLICLYYVLECMADSWVEDRSMRDKFKKPHIDTSPLDELVELVLEMLDCINKSAKERFEVMDVERKHEYPGPIKVKPDQKPLVDCNSEYSRSSSSRSPHTPNSVLSDSPKFADLLGAMLGSYSSPQLLNLRVQAVEELSPRDLKRLVAHVMPHFKANGNCQQNLKLASIEEAKIETGDNNVGEKQDSGRKNNEEGKSEKFENEEKETKNPTPTENEVLDIVQPPPLPEKAVTPRLRSSAHPPPPPPSPSYSPPHAPLPPPPSAAVPPPPPPPGNSFPPPPPPLVMGKEGWPPPPGQMMKRGVAPPPPGGMRTIVCPKNRTKLKRSTHMGNLYRILRGKVEGSCIPGGRSSPGNKNSTNGGSAGGGGGTSMADALAEMTKRSAYFQQIEEDMEKHGKAIKELQRDLNLFKTNDMDELLKFHNHVESLLEVLTDETQILSKFEGFPMNKLETLRMAAALSTKLNGIVSEIQNWKIEPPLAENLDKVEKFFNKIKVELEGLEHTKDEESKKFQSQNIHFDFSIFTKIKESMVDLSSGFIELALQERREEKAETTDNTSSKTDGKHLSSVKMLWRAFQFAFKVYSFAGGQDERADSLTKELAKEIETHQIQE